MKNYEELKTALMASQNLKNKKAKDYKEKERRVEQCVQMELLIQREIDESIKKDNSLMAEIAKRQELLNKLVTEKYQLIYARLFQRITDNTKILECTGMKQTDLMPLQEGLRMEYEASADMNWERFAETDINQRMDAYLERVKSND